MVYLLFVCLFIPLLLVWFYFTYMFFYAAECLVLPVLLFIRFIVETFKYKQKSRIVSPRVAITQL